jgi:hypothetical protein
MILLLFQSCKYLKKEPSLEKYGNIEIFEKGTISTQHYHEGLSFISPRRDFLIFTRSTKDFTESGIYTSKYQNKTWSQAKKIDLGKGNYDAGWTFAPDGKKAFFTKKVFVEGRKSGDLWNIWEIKVNEDFEFLSETVKLVEDQINSNAKDCCLTMDSMGNAFFSSDRDGSWNMYSANYSNGTFSNINKLKYPLNKDDSGEWPSYFDENTSSLFFSSIRKNGHGGDDIYVAKLTNGTWEEPILLDQPVNSTSYEDSARLTEDNGYLFFSSWRDSEFSTGVSNIYIKKQNGKM